MPILNGSSSDILTVIGLCIALFIALRCLFIFIYPLFCYNSVKISEREENLQTNENNEYDNIIYVRNIPIVKVENQENQENEGKQEKYRIPVATMV